MSIIKTLGGRVRALLVIVMSVALLFGLAACSSPQARDLSADGAIDAISCEEAVGVSNEISALAESKTKKRLSLRDWGIDPENAEQIKAVREALQKHAADCQASASASPSASPTATAAPTPTPEACSTWKRVDLGNDKNRWLVDGLPSLREAKTEQEARTAILEWVTQVRQDPVTLAGAAKYFLDRDIAQSELFDSKGCATEKAATLESELLIAVGQAQVKPEEAPSDGTNSGVDNGKVVASVHAGISGDRGAVKVTLSDGREIWVMARCANPVVRNPSRDIPRGKTDEPTPEPTPTKPVPSQPVMAPKDASKAKLGNPSSKEGIDPKAGEKVAPKGPTVKDPSGKTTTVKPADPTKPPKAPAPEAPAPGATPVPTTAPPPPPRETAAPAPSAPPATPIERGDPAP